MFFARLKLSLWQHTKTKWNVSFIWLRFYNIKRAFGAAADPKYGQRLCPTPGCKHDQLFNNDKLWLLVADPYCWQTIFVRLVHELKDQPSTQSFAEGWYFRKGHWKRFRRKDIEKDFIRIGRKNQSLLYIILLLSSLLNSCLFSYIFSSDTGMTMGHISTGSILY